MKKRIVTTLLLIECGENLLLGEKKRGFGLGKINGVGGKLEPNETPLDAVVRECREEIGVTPISPVEYGIIEFDEVVKNERCIVEMHIFKCNGYSENETPKESDEIKPLFVNKNQIPYDKMFEDDRYWLPELLKGRKFKGFFVYDDNLNLLKETLEFLN